MTRIRRVHVLVAAAAAALCVPAAGISSGNGLPTSVGKGEGQLNLIAWAREPDVIRVTVASDAMAWLRRG